jgi:flagellar motor switch protein FliN
MPEQSTTPASGLPRGSAAAPATAASLSKLPAYTRSLLHIQVHLSVAMASKRQRVGQIMELGPGSIIHFDKSCEEMLDLYVGQHRVAQGEAVKVGENFGLRVTSVIMPEERFKPVRSS